MLLLRPAIGVKTYDEDRRLPHTLNKIVVTANRVNVGATIGAIRQTIG